MQNGAKPGADLTDNTPEAVLDLLKAKDATSLWTTFTRDVSQNYGGEDGAGWEPNRAKIGNLIEDTYQAQFNEYGLGVFFWCVPRIEPRCYLGTQVLG